MTASGQAASLQRPPLHDGSCTESGGPSAILLRRKSADIVAKVTEQVLWNWNLKQSNRGVRTFESTLRVRVKT
jgi:hypothetical protein